MVSIFTINIQIYFLLSNLTANLHIFLFKSHQKNINQYWYHNKIRPLINLNINY